MSRSFQERQGLRTIDASTVSRTNTHILVVEGVRPTLESHDTDGRKTNQGKIVPGTIYGTFISSLLVVKIFL